MEPFVCRATVCVQWCLILWQQRIIGEIHRVVPPTRLALKWSDVDWLGGTLNDERGIVHQVVDDVKTPESERLMHIDTEVLTVLKSWKQQSQFSASEDWIFVSPVQIGRLPYSYPGVWRTFRRAAADAGVTHISSHSFRHTFRSWVDEVGTPLGVQKRLMRHTDIRTKHGNVFQAGGKPGGFSHMSLNVDLNPCLAR